jgi:hypothetical protein
MEKALAVEGMRLTHVIGPQTPHRYHPDSKLEISRRVDAIAERGRDPYPAKGPIYDLDAVISEDEVGEAGRTGEALGAGSVECRRAR